MGVDRAAFRKVLLRFGRYQQRCGELSIFILDFLCICVSIEL